MDKNTRNRFEEKYTTIPETDCWWWTASVDMYGYGQFWFRDTLFRAHRVSYEMHFGPIPDGLCVCHSCDEPSCVNPEHLFLGTHTENMRDMFEKGRRKNSSGSKHWKAKLTEKMVSEIKASSFSKAMLAEKYKVSESVINNIQKGRIWRHVN